MKKSLAALTLAFFVLVNIPFTSALQVGPETAVFALPEEKGNVILVNGATYSESGAYYGAADLSEGKIHAWFFPMFSMGNGTTNLRIAAQDCNVTVTSFTSHRILIESDLYNRTRILNCTIVGNGSLKVDFGMVTNQTTAVYIDGIQRQKGDGWNFTDFGVSITAAASDLAICTQYTDFVPPITNSPQFNTLTYAGIIIGLIIGVLIVFGMTEVKGYRHKQKTQSRI